ncbi:hypothetical protein BC332_09398 [Capsicum chinense]|uniref:Uncharacterized protein n=1 Tax=Capsicum annuum TaxID=4072 RepID=A0A1U8G895_CAPAN|nr:uncharacterized protein LOC107865883 isoform X1 [Capsicum annuum]KAF3628023.1 hypothetical protein FXO38_28459 [Capsicum annuum]PHT88678.1 hypothetical protein T459_10784 [Capsicum annuum]PHU24291.1 hypothetical protein BC332_09398 [Capsicum chinense]
MRRNLKDDIEPIRMSKRIAEAKSVMNPIVAVEARVVSKMKPKIAAAGFERVIRKPKLVPEIVHIEPVTKKKKKKVIKATKNERGKRPFASDATQADISYKSLYIETQKKVEDLREENYKQAIDLSYRSGQVDAYEYIIGSMKNVVGFSNTMRVTDAGMNLSKGTAPDAPSLNLNNLG